MEPAVAARRVLFVLGALPIALATRLVAVEPLPAAIAIGTGSLAALVIGLRVHGRHQEIEWRRAWRWIALGLAMLVLARVFAVRPSAAGWLPGSATLSAAVGYGAMAIGAFRLLRQRVGARAVDIAFEAFVSALAFAYIVWAVAVRRSTNGLLPQAEPLAAVALDIAVLWLLARLVSLSEEHPRTYGYLLAAFFALFTSDALVAASAIGDGSAAPGAWMNALRLWSFCLIGAAALHPSLRATFQPVPVRPAQVGILHVSLAVTAVLLGPIMLVADWNGRAGDDLSIIALGSTLLPLLVIAYLVYQVRERASAEYRARHDPLTGLPNRVLFQDRLEMALVHARRTDGTAVVMFLDLDRFKSINDSLGHAVGNQLLQGVAARLRSTLRGEDTVARMGGDEFTILLPEVARSRDAAAVAEKLLDAFRQPFTISGRQLYAKTSIGVAVYPPDGEDADTLLKNADTAMYRAKAKGRNNYQLYTADMSARARVRLSLESSLRNAVEGEELFLNYQPKISVETTAIVGVEALVRWRHPQLGLVSPEAFIPLAEESGVIDALGEWVLEAACRQNQAWVEDGLARVPIAVNLSARQFRQHPMERVVEGVLERTGLSPSLLELELTESVFIEDTSTATASLRAIKEMGVRLSIDDFGTGYSALNYLTRLPIDSVKIDRSFVQQIGDTEYGEAIVTAVIALARGLHMDVIAEGVETESQLAFLRDRGCGQVQGYLFSPPLPAFELEAKLPRLMATRPTSALTPEPGRLAELLHSLCVDGEVTAAEHGQLPLLLELLQPGLAGVAPMRTIRTASARLAAGTFAGLMPISGGLAAAGELPAPAQRIAAQVLANFEINVPDAASDRGDIELADGVRVRAERSAVGASSTSPSTAASNVSREFDEAIDTALDNQPAAPGPIDESVAVAPDEPAPANVTPPGQDGTRPVPPGQGHGATPPVNPPGQGTPPVTPPGNGTPPVTPPASGTPPVTPPVTPPANGTPPVTPPGGGQGATPPVNPPANGTPPVTPPGQGGTPPGNGTPPATPPGQGGTPPGNGTPPATPPGQGGTPPGNGTPPVTPPGQGGTPPGNGTLPVTPPGQGGTPPGQGTPPATPPGQGGTPPGQGTPPATPPGQGGTPPPVTPPGNGTPPVTPPGNGTPPVTPPGNGTSGQGGNNGNSGRP